MLHFLFAQATPDQVSSLSGWAAAGASVGLLGPVLYWLCYHHIPAKDKMIMDLVKEFREEAKESRQSNEDAITKVCETFSNEMRSERVAGEKRVEIILKHEKSP